MTIKVVSSQSQTDIDRERSSGDFKWAAREHAANMLRLVRGAGKAYQVPETIESLFHAMEKFREAHGAYPSQYDWNQALDVDAAWRELRPDGAPDPSDLLSADESDQLAELRKIAEAGIRDGMLQIAASMLLHQVPQVGAGRRQFTQHFRDLIEAHRRTHAYYDELRKTKSSMELAQEHLARKTKRKGPPKAKRKRIPPKIVK